MKKFIVLTLALVLVLGLCLSGCIKPEEHGRIHTEQPPEEEVHIKPLLYNDDLDDPLYQPLGPNSQFVEGVLVAELNSSEIDVTTMMSVDWSYIEDLQRKEPHHQYVATQAWHSTYGGRHH